MNSVTRTLIWTLVCLLTLTALALFAVPWALDQRGLRLRLEEKKGSETQTLLDFDPPAPGLVSPAPSLPASPTPADDPASEAGVDPAGEPAAPTDAGPLPLADNVILLIGDGMGFSQLAAARYALVGPHGKLELERFPVTGWSMTHSARELYTDSAAGATALSTGHKTLPGRVGVDVDGQRLETVLEMAVAAGKSAGLVTDSTFLDATPASFAAHRVSRRDYVAIAQDMAASGSSVVYGETRGRFEEIDGWGDAMGRFEQAGMVLVDSAEGLASTSSDASVAGFFPSGTIADPDQAPHLDDLAADALARLSRDPDGFFLMVETEETDTHSHRNNFEPVVAGVAALDAVAGRMVEFARSHGRTLVLATADHDTGGLAVLGGEHGESIRVRWATGNHTSEPVPLLAFGAGAEHFGGVHDNTEVGRLIQEVLGLSADDGQDGPAPN